MMGKESAAINLARQAKNIQDGVNGRLTNTESLLAQTAKITPINTNLSVIDMHHKIFHGTGYVSGETNTAVTTVSTIAGYTVTVLDASLFVLEQLVYLYNSPTDAYQINKIKSITGSNIELHFIPIVSTSIGSFYGNYAHPMANGYRALADDIIKDIREDLELIQTINPSKYALIGGSIAVDTDTISYKNFSDGYKVTLNANGTINYDINVLKPKNVRIKICCNPSGKLFNFMVKNMDRWAAESQFDITKSFNNTRDVISVEEFDVHLRSGINRLIINNTDTSNAVTFLLKKIEIWEKISTNGDNYLNQGTHIALGDSWFAQDILVPRLRLKLPNANIENYGVGGDTVDRITERFDAIPLTKRMDVVWIVVGTNDFYASVTAKDFNRKISLLISKILQRGAKPILVNNSVGDIATAGLLKLSRDYTDLYPVEKVLENSFRGYTSVIPFHQNIAASGNWQVSSLHIDVGWKVTVAKVDFNYLTGMQVYIGFTTSVTGLPTDQQQAVDTATGRDYTFTNMLYGRYFNIFLKNNDAGSAHDFVGSIQLRIEPV